MYATPDRPVALWVRVVGELGQEAAVERAAVWLGGPGKVGKWLGGVMRRAPAVVAAGSATLAILSSAGAAMRSMAFVAAAPGAYR